uniref:Uncharacterized protein n=1 Tax=Zea mays TaxID=4577 RepID=B7ZY81_MAIZE|nr:unknown [Zea mays]|eukprot:NP_001145935.1 uncharacterized protein LOC100279458 [Zea mays]
MERVLSTLESTAMTRLVHCGLVVLIHTNSRSMSVTASTAWSSFPCFHYVTFDSLCMCDRFNFGACLTMENAASSIPGCQPKLRAAFPFQSQRGTHGGRSTHGGRALPRPC